MHQKTGHKRRDFLSFCCVAPFSTDILLKDFSKPANCSNVGRRVVTGINGDGKSVILNDGIVPENARYSEPHKIKVSALWVEPKVPVDLNKNSESLEGYNFSFEPTSGGFTAYALTLEPGFYAEYHQTNTIDFVFIISGKLELILEKGSTILSAGDSVVQRGTNHAWRVIGKEPCTFGALMISALKN